MIAETKLIMRDKDGRRREIHIKIGRPYELPDGDAACPLSMDGLYGKVHDIHGIDTFQALVLAVGFVRLTLRALEKKGATFFEYFEGKDYPVDIDFLFGMGGGFRGIIGIGGASCAGKTVLAEALAARLRDAVVLPVDAYYRDLSHLPIEKRAAANFDEPAAIDHELLIEHVRLLRDRRPVEQPVYDFALHMRRAETKRLHPAAFIIVEGLLALCWPELRTLYSAAVFVAAPDAECLARRTTRDVRDRGRTPESVRAQYEATVRPMYDTWCWETVQYADLVLDGCAGVDGLAEQVVGLLRGKGLLSA
jgi:uridine kinase